MALEGLKSILTHLVEMQRQAPEANKDTVVSLIGGLNSQFQNHTITTPGDCARAHGRTQGVQTAQAQKGLQRHEVHAQVSRKTSTLGHKCTHEDILTSTGQDGVDTDNENCNYFIAKTKGNAGTIVSQGQDCGCKALRLLALWVRSQERRDEVTPHEEDHDPENLGDHRGVGQAHHELGVHCPTKRIGVRHARERGPESLHHRREVSTKSKRALGPQR